MYTAKDEQNHLTKYTTEFKSKTRPQSDSKFKKVKEDVLNSAMIHLKGKEIMFKVFENGIFSRLEQSKQSEQSRSDDKYTSSKLNNDLIISSNVSNNSGISLITPIKKGTILKILTPNQMFQKLAIAIPQVKASNNLENLLNEIRQILYSLHQSKQIATKVCNNIIKS